MPTRVLIADDALIMRSMIRTILTDDGFEVVGEAADGVEAVEQYKQHKPDLVTMDIVMPRRDGIAAVKSIIEHDPGARIIVCSSLGQQPMVADAIRAGAKGFIIKPFDGPTLLAAVHRVVA